MPEIFMSTGTSVAGTGESRNFTDKAAAEAYIKQTVQGWKDAAAATLLTAESARDVLLATAHDYQANGVTYTGTTVPATPADEVVNYLELGPYCGIQHAVVTSLADGMKVITNYKRSAGYAYSTRKRFRWVQDVAYVPAGAQVWDLTAGYVTANPIQDPAGVEATKFNAAMATAMATADGIYTQAQYPTKQSFVEGVLVPIFVAAGCTSGYGTYWRSFLAQLEYGYNTIGSWYGWGTMSFTSSPGVQGQWHQEEDFAIIAPFWQAAIPETCEKHSITIGITDNRGNKKDPRNAGERAPLLDSLPDSPPQGYVSSGSLTTATGTHGVTGSVASLRNINGSGYSMMPNIFLEDLTQGDLPEGYTAEGVYHPAVTMDFTTPGASFTVQTGSAEPGYILLKGAYVYDLLLKKWGKLKADYNLIAHFDSVNAFSSPQFDYTDIGMTAGLFVSSTGLISILDDEPTDSFLRYGKIGYYRLGYTNVFELHVSFRRFGDCTFLIEASTDGASLDPSLSHTETFANVMQALIHPDISARWFTVKVSGNYDLTGMEFRGKIASRR